MPQKQLDNPAWCALTGPHRHLATINGMAARYPFDVSPITAVEAPTPQALADLAAIIPPGRMIGMGGSLELDPSLWVHEHEGKGVRMLCTAPDMVDAGDVAILELGAADAPEMVALVKLTEPGPFEDRTYLMGRYFGIRMDGELVAMAGQRLATDDYVEISAVCTHPAHRRKGYASILSSHVMQVIYDSGKTPFLHARADNVNAIRAYEKLGFELIAETTINLIKRVG